MAVLNAANFGVPQRREGVFIVGVRQDLRGEFQFPSPTHASPKVALELGLEPWVTSKQAIGDLEDEERLKSLPNHEFSKAKFFPNRNQEKILDPDSPSPTILARGTTGLPMHYRPRQGDKPIKPDEPSPTIRAEHHGHIEVHYNSLRRLSVREAARLQSFPDDFVFVAPMSEAYKLVGNAAPPVLAWHLARSIHRFLSLSNSS